MREDRVEEAGRSRRRDVVPSPGDPGLTNERIHQIAPDGFHLLQHHIGRVVVAVRVPHRARVLSRQHVDIGRQFGHACVAVVQVQEADPVGLKKKTTVLLVAGIEIHRRRQARGKLDRLLVVERNEVLKAQRAEFPGKAARSIVRHENLDRLVQPLQQPAVEMVLMHMRDVKKVELLAADRLQTEAIVRIREPGLEEGWKEPGVDQNSGVAVIDDEAGMAEIVDSGGHPDLAMRDTAACPPHRLTRTGCDLKVLREAYRLH